MDFFAGSGTTAHAVAELNKNGEGKRKCILMESDCLIPPKHQAIELGYRQIADITADRLQIIRESNPEFTFDIWHQNENGLLQVLGR